MAQTRIVLNDGLVRFSNVPRIASGLELDDRLTDLSTIANSVFQAEPYSGVGGGISRIEIPVRSEAARDSAPKLEALWSSLFGYTPAFDFVDDPQSLLEKHGEVKWKDSYSCPFSCGMDSFAAIMSAAEKHSVEGAITLHKDFGTLVNLASDLHRRGLGPAGISLRGIPAAKHGPGTRLTRGLLYVLNAVLLGNRNVIVPEIGPTMYQPPFNLLDEISVTTRPEVLTAAKGIAETVTGQRIRILKPNEDLTKAELVAVSPKRDFLHDTCSCRTVRFADSDIPHCGSCYGCVVRRLAVVVAGVVDRGYRANGFEGEGRDNMAHLVRFSADYLSDPKSLPRYTTEIIDKYQKRGLFERFALDNLAGLVLMTKGASDGSLQGKLRGVALRAKDEDELNERVEVIRSAEAKPDFENVL